MDISHFDFTLDELVALLPRLPGMVSTIEVEPRVHQAEEPEAIHPLRTDPTFRVQCRLLGGDRSIRQVATLESEAGINAVLDHDNWIRLRHLPST